MTPRQLIDTATRHQVLLERLKTQQVADFQKVFPDIDKTVRDILNNLGVNKLNEITRNRLKEVLAQLESAQSDVYGSAVTSFVDGLPDISEFEANFEAKALKSVLTPEGRDKVDTVSADDAFQAALDKPIQATGDHLTDMVDGWSDGAIQKTNNAIKIGYDQGKTVPQIVSSLQGTEANRYLDGITAINTRQSATVVRTAVQHVANTARDATYEENSDIVKGILWVSTLDSKTTLECQSLDGQVFPLDSGPRPPIHPNCRSCTAPDIAPEFDFLDKGATRSSEDGPVDADLTYYDWLKTQDDDFQDEALGPERAQLFRDGGLSADEFAKLQLDKNFQTLTLDEMKEIAPVAFQRAGLVEDFNPEDSDALSSQPAPTEKDIQAALSRLDKLPIEDEDAEGNIQVANPLKQIRHDDMPDLVSHIFYSNEKLQALTSEIELVDPRSILSEQYAVTKDGVARYIKQGGGLISSKPAELTLAETNRELSVPVAIRHEGKLYLVDGNHRVAGQLLLNRDLVPIRVYDTGEKTAIVSKPKEIKLPGRPGAGTATGKVWDIADGLQTSLGRIPTRQEMIAATVDSGINPSTVSVQYGKWKQAFGAAILGGTAPVAVEPAVTKAAVETAKKVEALVATVQPAAANAKTWTELKQSLDKIVEGTSTTTDTVETQLRGILNYYYKTYPDGRGDVDIVALSRAGVNQKKAFLTALDSYKQSVGREFAYQRVTKAEAGSNPIHDLLAKLNDARASQNVLIPNGVTAGLRAKVEQAQTFVDSIVNDKFKRGTVTVEENSKFLKADAAYVRQGREVWLRTDNEVKTVVHELVHHFEYEAGSSALQRIDDWLTKRQGSEAFKGYNTIRGGKDVQIFEDKWINRGGRVYSSRTYRNPNGTLRSSEVITTGAERLFLNPIEFYRKDPEHFEITVRTLMNLW